jgi:hypothetical protein
MQPFRRKKCWVNNPQKIPVYVAVLSQYVNRLVKLINKKGQTKSSLIFGEFPTIYLNNMDSLIYAAIKLHNGFKSSVK